MPDGIRTPAAFGESRGRQAGRWEELVK
jgi:hypothetical protein